MFELKRGHEAAETPNQNHVPFDFIAQRSILVIGVMDGKDEVPPKVTPQGVPRELNVWQLRQIRYRKA